LLPELFARQFEVLKAARLHAVLAFTQRVVFRPKAEILNPARKTTRTRRGIVVGDFTSRGTADGG